MGTGWSNVRQVCGRGVCPGGTPWRVDLRMNGRLSTPADPISGRSVVAHVILTKSVAPALFLVEPMYIPVYLPINLSTPISSRVGLWSLGLIIFAVSSGSRLGCSHKLEGRAPARPTCDAGASRSHTIATTGIPPTTLPMPPPLPRWRLRVHRHVRRGIAVTGDAPEGPSPPPRERRRHR